MPESSLGLWYLFPWKFIVQFKVAIVRYLINNYTEQNFKRWKRKFNIVLCLYAFILTFILDFSNNSIRIIIIEYMSCYFLLEMYEKYNNGNFKNQNKEFEFNRDDVIKTELIESENYDPELFDIKKFIKIVFFLRDYNKDFQFH